MDASKHDNYGRGKNLRLMGRQRWESSTFPFSAGAAVCHGSPALGQLELSVQRWKFRKDCRAGRSLWEKFAGN